MNYILMWLDLDIEDAKNLTKKKKEHFKFEDQ